MKEEPKPHEQNAKLHTETEGKHENTAIGIGDVVQVRVALCLLFSIGIVCKQTLNSKGSVWAAVVSRSSCGNKASTRNRNRV